MVSMPYEDFIAENVGTVGASIERQRLLAILMSASLSAGQMSAKLRQIYLRVSYKPPVIGAWALARATQNHLSITMLNSPQSVEIRHYAGRTKWRGVLRSASLIRESYPHHKHPMPEMSDHETPNGLQLFRLNLDRSAITALQTVAARKIIMYCLDTWQSLADHGELVASDSLKLIVLIHNAFRSQLVAGFRKMLCRHAHIFTARYVSGDLMPHREASHRLLAFLQESGQTKSAIDFWQWLSQQDEGILAWETHGIALQVISQAGFSLEHCEDYYRKTIDKLPATISRKPFLRGSMLPRTFQACHFDIPRATAPRSIHHILLAYSDWRNAYLSLDVFSRFWPTTMGDRGLELAMKFRPVHESYQVFCLCCIGGNHIRGRSLSMLLGNLVFSLDVPTHMPSQDLRLRCFAIINAMVQAIEMYLGIGAALDSRHLTRLVRGTLTLSPLIDISDSDVEKHNQNATSGVIRRLILQMFRMFETWGITPNGDVCATIIAASASLRDRALFEMAEKIIECNDLPYNDWIRERQLYAGQRLRDPGMVRTAWKCLIDIYRQSQRLPGSGQWYLFAEAAKDVGLEAYYYQQLQDYIRKHGKPKRANNTMPDTRVDSDRRPWSEADQRSIRAFCGEVASRLESLEKTNFSLRNREKALASTSIWKWPEVPQEWQYALYDELSTDKDEAPLMPPVISSNMVSKTGIPFEELRFLYWKSINNLLIQAEDFELRANGRGTASTYNAGGAILNPVRRNRTICREDVALHLMGIEEESLRLSGPYTYEEWRTRILNLRSEQYQPPQPRKGLTAM